MSAHATPLALQLADLDILDALAPWLLVIMIAIAAGLGSAVRIVCNQRGRDTSGFADDPYFFPIADTPPVDAQFIDFRREHDAKIAAAFGVHSLRSFHPLDFRAWGIPTIDKEDFARAALRQNESGGRRFSKNHLGFPRGGRRLLRFMLIRFPHTNAETY